MFESKLAVIVNPQFLNKFEESKTTIEMVEKAVEEGYRIDSDTPLFLFKYDPIIELFLKNFKLHYNPERLDVMLKNDNKRKDVLAALALSVANYGIRISDISIPKEYFGDIEKNDSTIDLIQKYLGIEYLEYSLEYVYSEYFNIGNYDKNELFEFFKVKNIDLSKIKIDKVYDFVELIEYFPEILKMECFVKFLKESNVLNKIIKMISENNLKFEQIPEALLSNEDVANALVIQDFNLIDKFKGKSIKIDMVKVASIFVQGLPESLKYIENLSNEISEVYFIKYIDQIINAIYENDFIIKNCKWSFIYNNVELMLDQFEKNPDVINTFDDFLTYAHLDDSQRKRLYDLLNREEVEVKRFLKICKYDENLLKIVVEKNPYILSTIGEDRFDKCFANIEDIPVTPSAACGSNFSKDIEEAIRMNPDNCFALYNQHFVDGEMVDKCYVAALEFGRNPYRVSFINDFYERSHLIKIDHLRLSGGPSNKEFLITDSKNEPQNMYIIANYPDMVKAESTMKYRASVSKKTIFKNLYEDFSNYDSVIWYQNLTEEELIELKDLFYKYKDTLKIIPSKVYENPYVFIEEILKNGTCSYRISKLTNEQLEYFNKRFKELGLKCNSVFIDYIRDFDIFMEYGMEYGFRFSINWLNESQKKVFFDQLKECVKGGKLDYNFYPIEFFLEEFEFVKEHFDKYAILKKMDGLTFNASENPEIYSYLRENTGYICYKDYYKGLNDEEFEKLIESNVNYFRTLFVRINEESPLYYRKHIIEKVLSRVTSVENIDPINIDYLLEQNKVDVVYFHELYKNKIIDYVTYKNCYLKILDNLKNGAAVLDDNFVLEEEFIDDFDSELYNIFSLFGVSTQSEYLKICFKKDYRKIILYLIHNHQKLSSYDLMIILRLMTTDDLVGLVDQCGIKVDVYIFAALMESDAKGIFDERVVYKYWEMAGKPTNNKQILRYFNICKEIVGNDISMFDDKYEYCYSDNETDLRIMFNVYNSFKECHISDISVSPFLYENDLILMYLNNIPISMPYKKLSSSDKYSLILNLCKDNKALFANVFDNYSYRSPYRTEFLYSMIEEKTIDLMFILNYRTFISDKIIKKLKEIAYIPDKSTPVCYFMDSEFVKLFLDNHPEDLGWLIQVLNENNIILSDNIVNEYVSNKIKEEKMYGEFKRVLYDDEYIIESLKRNVYYLDRMNGVEIGIKALKFIYPFVLEKINTGEYVASENTPSFIYYNEEIRNKIRKIRPDLVESFFLTKLDNALDSSLIEEALLHPEIVDDLFNGVDRNFSEELVDRLVEKLIFIKYQVTEKTPKFLMRNSSFVYYALKHDMIIEEKYIDNFTTFESYYKILDRELFIELIDKGYGMQMQSFVKFVGIDRTLELAAEYGYLLSIVSLECAKDEEKLIYTLVRMKCIDVVLKSKNLKKVLDVVKKNNLYINEFFKELIDVYVKDFDNHREDILSLFRFGIHPNLLTDLYDNQDLYDLYIDSVLSMDYLIWVINDARDSNLTRINVLKAIRKGYIISDKTPDIIKQNEEYVELIIKTCRDEKKLIEMIDSNKDIVLNNNALQYLANSFYVISANTPDTMLNNVSFIISYLNKLNNSYYFREVIELLNDNVIAEVIENVDLQKFILYFQIGDENKQVIVNKYLKNCNEKKDLLIKLIIDGRKMKKSFRESFEKYFLTNIDTMDFEQMERLKKCLTRIEFSNSGEVRQFADVLVPEIIKLPNYEEVFAEIEKIFLTNFLPVTMKLFLVFKVLNKDYSRFCINGRMSPVLLNCATDEQRDVIIYNDLVNIAFASNNRSIREYLEDLNDACKLLELYENDKDKVNEIDLVNAVYYLLPLINESYIPKNPVGLTNRNECDYYIALIKDEFKGYSYSNLRDVIVQKLFDISSYDMAIALLNDNAKRADRENRLRSMEPFCLESGDFIKGIGGPIYLTNILQNGSVAREFLGDSAGSDSTPLDTDLCKILVVGDTLEDSIDSTAANSYGPVWFVLKDGSHIVDTRKPNEDAHPELYDGSKLESFYTGVLDHDNSPHYGIRTGFASSQISYIIAEDNRVFLEVALNGFYIPVVNKKGELIFTPDDYDKLRKKMSGLDCYGAGPYQIASKEDLIMPGVQEFAYGIQGNRESVRKKHIAIKNAVCKGMNSVGIKMNDKLDGNVIPGFADFIDIGSTARGTDLPGKADFDYICRVDRNLFFYEDKFREFREALIAQFGHIDKKEFDGKNFRFKGVCIQGLEEKVDLDISFTIRTSKLSLSSDESLLRVLNGIEKGYFIGPDDQHDIGSGSEARDLVSANILVAKKLLKAYGCYKNRHNRDNPQGGLGGIGVENWILQNGGSLKLAAQEFLKFVDESDSFDDFKNRYCIWDFGQNHYSFDKDKYSHDNFVYNNMDEKGYARMVVALRNYLSLGEKAFDEEIIASLDDGVKSFLEEKSKNKGKTY